MYPDKHKRYIDSYVHRNQKLDRRRLFSINMKLLPWWKRRSLEEIETMKELRTLKKKQTELRQELKKIKRANRK